MTESESAEEYLKKHLLVNLKPNKIIDNFVYHKDALRAIEMARKQEQENIKVVELCSGLMESVGLKKIPSKEELKEFKSEVAKKIFKELEKQEKDGTWAVDSRYESIRSRWVGSK